jgi:hypothetical protein
MRVSFLVAGLALCGFVCFPGCEAKKMDNAATHSDHDGHDHAGHDHDDHAGHDHGPSATKEKAKPADAHAGHDHSHDVGPNGGHIADISPLAAHIEWIHDDEANKVTIHAEEVVSNGGKIDSVQIVITSGNDTKKFDLAKVADAKIADSVYALADQEMMTLIGASGTEEKGVQAKLVITVDGKENSCLLVHEHGHKH